MLDTRDVIESIDERKIDTTEVESARQQKKKFLM